MATPEELRQKHVCAARRVVVKVGSNILAPPGKPLDDGRVAALADQVAWLVDSGREAVLVSSGAIACGMSELGMTRRPTTMPRLQAAASVGQGTLVARYEEHFRRHGLHAAQVLLTRDDFDDRARYLNASNTLHALLDMPCVPVINENDTISTEEIKLGDNDLLSALVTHLCRADLLILLTSVPGVYAERPGRDKAGQVLEVVQELNGEVQDLVYDEKTPNGLGGMASKLQAGAIAARSGEAAVIADGRDPQIIQRIMAGENVGTLFVPARNRLSSYKRWLRFTSRPRGSVQVDEGAVQALLKRGKSLLPSGVVGVDGRFGRGDVVRVVGPDGNEVARGLSNYACAEVESLKGCQTRRIKSVLGHEYYDEIIHRDNLALMD